MWLRKFAVVTVEVILRVVAVVAVIVPPAHRVERWIVCPASETHLQKPTQLIKDSRRAKEHSIPSIVASVHKFCCCIVCRLFFNKTNKEKILFFCHHAPSHPIALTHSCPMMTCAAPSNISPLLLNTCCFSCCALKTVVAHRFNRNTAPIGK